MVIYRLFQSYSMNLARTITNISILISCLKRQTNKMLYKLCTTYRAAYKTKSTTVLLFFKKNTHCYNFSLHTSCPAKQTISRQTFILFSLKGTPPTHRLPVPVLVLVLPWLSLPMFLLQLRFSSSSVCTP